MIELLSFCFFFLLHTHCVSVCVALNACLYAWADNTNAHMEREIEQSQVRLSEIYLISTFSSKYPGIPPGQERSKYPHK